MADKNPAVLIIVENLPVPFDRRVWTEATALRKAGHQVSIICPTGRDYQARYELLDGIHIYRHPLPTEAKGALGYAVEYSAALFWELLLALRVYRRHGFDIIHACNPPDLIFLIAGLFKLFCGTRFVFDHHDITPELLEVKFGRRGLMHRVLSWLERLTFRLADVSIATSGSLKDLAVERGGMAPDNVFVVRSAPDINRFRRTTPDNRLRNGRRFVVGYVGIINSQDGVDYLVEAMQHIVQDHRRNDVQCVVVGDGPELPRLKAMAAELGVADSVTFTGYLRGEPLLQALSTFDVGVIPDPSNVYNDKISMNKCFEYMALSLPIVLFELPESRRLVGEAGVCANANDPSDLAVKVLEVLADPARRERMAAIGRRRVETELSWEHEEPQLHAAYAAAMRSRPQLTALREQPRSP